MRIKSKKAFFRFIEQYIIEEYGLEEMDVELLVEDFQEEIEDFVKEKEARKKQRSFY